MLGALSAPARRGVLVAAAAAGVWSLLPAIPVQISLTEAARPRNDVPEYARVVLQERLAALQSAERETVAMNSYREDKVPERPIVARFAGRGAAWDESRNSVRPLLGRGRDDKAAAERVMAQFLVAGSPAKN